MTSFLNLEDFEKIEELKRIKDDIETSLIFSRRQAEMAKEATESARILFVEALRDWQNCKQWEICEIHAAKSLRKRFVDSRRHLQWCQKKQDQANRRCQELTQKMAQIQKEIEEKIRC